MDDDPLVPYAKREPHELRYDAKFEDSVMRVVLDDSTKQDGLDLIMDDETEEQPQDAIRASDVNIRGLALVEDAELPLPLTDSRRIYSTTVPGIKITHPGGYLEGGPGSQLDDEDTFTREFLTRHEHIIDPNDLSEAIRTSNEENMALLRKRMHARQRAIQANEQIEKQIQNMVDTHNTEYKVRQRLMDEAKAKKEAREKKRREREGG